MPTFRWTLLPPVLIQQFVFWVVTRQVFLWSRQVYFYISDTRPSMRSPSPPPPSSPAVNELPTCSEEPIYEDDMYAGDRLSRPNHLLSGRMKPFRRSSSSDASGYLADALECDAFENPDQQELELLEDDTDVVRSAERPTRAKIRERRRQLSRARQSDISRRSQCIRDCLACDLLKLQEVDTILSEVDLNQTRLFSTSAIGLQPLLLDSTHQDTLSWRCGKLAATAWEDYSHKNLCQYTNELKESLLHGELFWEAYNKSKKALKSPQSFPKALDVQYLFISPEQTDFEVRYSPKYRGPWSESRHDDWFNLERKRRQLPTQPRSHPENRRSQQRGPSSDPPEHHEGSWRREESQYQNQEAEPQATGHLVSDAETTPNLSHAQQQSPAGPGPRPNPPHNPQPAAPPPIPKQFSGQSQTPPPSQTITQAPTRTLGAQSCFSSPTRASPSHFSTETYEHYTSLSLASLLDHAQARSRWEKQEHKMQTSTKGDKDTHIGDSGGAGSTDVIAHVEVTMSAESIRPTAGEGDTEINRNAEDTAFTNEGGSKDDKSKNDENDSGYGSETSLLSKRSREQQ